MTSVPRVKEEVSNTLRFFLPSDVCQVACVTDHTPVARNPLLLPQPLCICTRV